MLDRVHKVAEIVAAFAIVGSLIFVGIQLRQNTSAMDAEQRTAAMNIWSQQGMAVATSKSLSEEIERFSYPFFKEVPGSDAGRIQVMSYVTVTMNTVENQHRQFLDGNLSEEEWTNFRNGMVANLTSIKAYADYWENARPIHSPRFAKLFDELLVEAAERRRLYTKSIGYTEGE
jgi:hypothetical protein